MSENNKIIMPMLPLRGLIIFPHTILPLLVGRKKSILSLNKSVENYNNKIFLVAQKNSEDDNPKPDNIYKVGTIANIVKIIKDRENASLVKVIVEGVKRARIINYETKKDYYEVNLSIEEDKNIDSIQEKAYMNSLLLKFNRYAQFKDNIPSEILMSMKSVNDSRKLIDILISNLDVSLESKQHILEIFNIIERMDALLKLIQSEIEVLKLGKKIDESVKERIEENRKRFVLNQKMELIKEELGDKVDYESSLENLKNNILKKEMPKQIEERVLEEFEKLKFMPSSSSEANVIKNYIDWVITLPWNESSIERKNLKKAKNILNKNHYGIEDVKERILEFLAVRILSNKPKGSILCLVGPPGVGKTSLVKSIANATGRKYVKLALGGVKDESEIRGHRRTYIGSMPGNIIQSLKKAKTNNPVFLLDEIDKISSGLNGDPLSALLEVLDPEQNSKFIDHYINLEFDLSKIFFIATANNLQNIPNVLKDRLEIIFLSGYTYEEKEEIAIQHLIKKVQTYNGLSDYNIKLNKQALKKIINQYTRESGVRNLEREISKIFRKIAKTVLIKSLDKNKKINITPKNIKKYLGVEKYLIEKKEQKSTIGVVSGLAWTSFGGEVLKIEVIVMPGKGKIEITGKLGEVMIESAKAALSYVRSKANNYNIASDFYEKTDIHIHVPDGAIPKDGPSAGITISTALISSLSKRSVKNDLAMTGEITLRGFVLPIGGLKEKLLAAIRAGITTIIIPKDNKKDLYDIEKNILKKLNIIAVERVEEVWQYALEN